MKKGTIKKVLKYAGTGNFRKEMMDALEEQEFRKNKTRLQIAP